MQDLVTYLVAAMTSWVPLHAQVSESAEDSAARYQSIAQDAVSVAFDESEQPLFWGPEARAETALLLLSIASFESAYRKGVDEGTVLGDHGHSYCLMQIRVGDRTTGEGWSGPDLVADRTRCFRSALHILHGSFGVCHNLPILDRMSAYATGMCIQGATVSRVRIGRALQWWETHQRPTDT
jgi:hypothetical protein